ncbi:MAG: hypothetical protein HGB28_00435 [Oscillochloris sp.]|nr:hypothetical protein [Oscillochloris sp.]
MIAMLALLFLIIGLIVWVVITLRAANRNDQSRDDDSHVVHTGREVLKMIAIMVAIALVLLVIFCGTCLVTLTGKPSL